MASDLKPCPFCGGEAKLKQDIRYPRPACKPKKAFEVECQNSECIIGFVDERYRLSEQEAIDAWNRRAGTENVRHGVWTSKGIAMACDHCKRWLVVEQGDADMNYCPNCGAKMDGGKEIDD